ncbi:MAG: hypothetical protein EHM48_01160 [Planctomycetaceae bacterium]|nr:MAG: hypothetical protein EHM48_01160 [Planctomycetaceae bacterium]
MDKLTITSDDLVLAVLESQPQCDGAGMTSKELAQETGLSNEKIMKRLHTLKKGNRLTVVRILREAIDGRIVRVPGYRLVSDDGMKL